MEPEIQTALENLLAAGETNALMELSRNAAARYPHNQAIRRLYATASGLTGDHKTAYEVFDALFFAEGNEIDLVNWLTSMLAIGQAEQSLGIAGKIFLELSEEAKDVLSENFAHGVESGDVNLQLLPHKIRKKVEPLISA